MLRIISYCNLVTTIFYILNLLNNSHRSIRKNLDPYLLKDSWHCTVSIIFTKKNCYTDDVYVVDTRNNVRIYKLR